MPTGISSAHGHAIRLTGGPAAGQPTVIEVPLALLGPTDMT